MAPLVAACEIMSFPPTSRDSSLATFEGTVLGYSKEAVSLGAPILASGVLIEVTKSLGVVRVGSTVTVVPLDTGSSCERVPRTLENIKREYPPHSKVAVVGEIEDGSAQLILSWAETFGTLARVLDLAPRTDGGCLDFSRFKQRYEDNSYDTYSLEVAWRNFHRRAYEDYEFFLCLSLLEELAETSDGVSDFLNLSYYSRYDRIRPKHAKVSYRTLLTNAGLSKRARRPLVKEFVGEVLAN